MSLGIAQNGDRIEIRVPCRAEYVRTIRRTLGEFAETLNMPGSAVEEVQIAASEAVTNIIEHAYGRLSRLPPLKVKCSHNTRGLVVEIADRGGGFRMLGNRPSIKACIQREGGLGITLITHLMDSVIYSSRPDEGTRIRMVKYTGDHRVRAYPIAGKPSVPKVPIG